MSDVFLLSWDCNGIEAVVNVTEHEKELAWAHLANQPNPARQLRFLMSSLMLRARANPQRHYEIYTVAAGTGITESDLRAMFEVDPQGSADLIRERGKKIYSDRAIETARIT